MTTTELLNLFRAEMRDEEEPYLFQDAQIYAYINAAQLEFCRLTEGIEDARSFKLTIVPGTDWYPINKRILKLRKAYDAVTGREVRLINTENATAAGVEYRGLGGPLRAIVVGAQKSMVRAYPVPNISGSIQLEVFRLSNPVEKDDDLEIDEHHHIYLLYWVKRLAYGVHDAETFDARKVAQYEQMFKEYCVKAKDEQVRARHQVGSVAYGGI